MDYQLFADEIIQMKDYDLQVRQRLSGIGELFAGYNKEMEQVHIKNAERLDAIIGQIGWLAKDKIGQQGRDAAMLIVQHAISLPDFQRTCLRHIKEAIDKGQEDKRNYALLYDRICFNERRPQKFGTQYDWDKDGQMSPWTIENPEAVNALRQEYGLNTIEEETKAVRQRVKDSGETPPAYYETRQLEIYEWSKKKEWIKI
ncbi:MAG: hypothetical protein IIA88_07020 [Bacteroidetes bacterium]|nr:hypothetical protein [Bacteroidota bacterium]